MDEGLGLGWGLKARDGRVRQIKKRFVHVGRAKAAHTRGRDVRGIVELGVELCL